jgi:hypothetical protein
VSAYGIKKIEGILERRKRTFLDFLEVLIVIFP